eukprot:gene10255-biopygen15316
MGPEVGSAFQRLPREPLSAILSVRVAGTGSRHVDSKELHAFMAFVIVGSRAKTTFLAVSNFRILSRVGARDL